MITSVGGRRGEFLDKLVQLLAYLLVNVGLLHAVEVDVDGELGLVESDDPGGNGLAFLARRDPAGGPAARGQRVRV